MRKERERRKRRVPLSNHAGDIRTPGDVALRTHVFENEFDAMDGEESVLSDVSEKSIYIRL